MTEHICQVCFIASWRHRDPGYLSPRCCHGCPCGVTRPRDEDDEDEEVEKPSRKRGGRS